MFLLGPGGYAMTFFMHFHQLHLDGILSSGGKIERRRQKKKNEGEMDDRRQRKWRRETHQRGEVCVEAEGKMRKKVSLHQTEELPLLQKKSQRWDWMKRDTLH